MHLPHRNTLAGLALVASLAASLALGLAACSQAPPPPNLVVVALDTLRPDHLGCYGYERPTSPHLDALAAQSVVFEQAESTAPWTAPAMISLMTGLLPRAHGVYRFPNPGRLNERATTLAEVLSERGYATGAFTEGGYAKGEFGLDQGFDVFPANPGDAQTHMSNMLNPSRLAGNLDRALVWLEEQRDGPFFMLFQTYEVHGPLRAPDEYVRLFDREWDDKREHDRLAGVLAHWRTSREIDRAGAVLVHNHNFHCTGAPPPGLQKHMHDNGLLPEDGAPFYPETLEFLRDQYDAEIAYTDAQLERLWAALREHGLEENTVVVVVSDHGEAFGEHGILGHGSQHFSEQLGVVFMVRAPGLAPARIARPVSTLSLMRTVLDLLGISIERRQQGESLAPLMRGETAQGPTGLYSQGLSIEGEEERLISMRIGQFRIVLDTETGEAQLFDLEADPGELRDVTAEHPGRAAMMKRLLTAEIEIDLNLGRLVAGEVGTADLDAETLRRLAELGYIDGQKDQ